MSFGASPSDIIIVVTFCKALYRKCRDAGGEYDEISREVRGMYISSSKHLVIIIPVNYTKSLNLSYKPVSGDVR